MLFLDAGNTQATYQTCGSWNVVSSPNIGTGHNYLEAVAAVAATDIWAVGSVYGHFPHAQTLIEHLERPGWQLVPSPGISSQIAAYLHGVTALASNDVWAVGSSLNERPDQPDTG